MPRPLSPSIVIENGVTVVTLGPDCQNIDEHTLDAIRDALMEVSQAEPPLVVMDLSHTKFFGSSFIEVLFRLWNRLNTRQGGEFALSGLQPYCAEVLTITHLDQLWRTFPDSRTAVQAMGTAAKT